MRRILFLMVAAAGLAGCAVPYVRAPENGEAAVYVLEEVDDQQLPFLHGIGSAVAQQELTEGMLQLRANGRFYLDLTYLIYSPTGPRHSGRVHEGMWTRVGERIDFEFDTGVVEHADVINGVIHLTIDGHVFQWAQ